MDAAMVRGDIMLDVSMIGAAVALLRSRWGCMGLLRWTSLFLTLMLCIDRCSGSEKQE
jgi:hypothetical protein